MMPYIAPLLLVFPTLLTATLCVVARRVNMGNAGAQAFEHLHAKAVAHWQFLLDLVMLALVASFILAIDENDTHSARMFLTVLYYLSFVSVVFAGSGYLFSRAWTSVVLRKIAFRAIMCLALFIMLLGMKAAGIGHSERPNELARLADMQRL